MNKDHIIKNNYDFQRIIKKYKPYKFKDYILYIEYGDFNNYKFGFSVGKKIGNAVTRNKIKRQLKQILSKKVFQKSFNCIIIVGRGILTKEYFVMEQDLTELFTKLNLIKEKKDV